MPGGEIRRNNLLTLVKRAEAFQGGTYTELGDFIQYIDGMIKYQILVNAGTSAKTQQAVRIMTIHASKGL